MIPYGKQSIDKADLKAVLEVLKSDWITQGPKIAEFEKAVAGYSGARYAVAVSSGTAALHAACFAAGIEKGDEVITSPITFAASANCVLYLGGRPVFADIKQDTLNIAPEEIRKKITKKTKAIIPVDFAGQPADYDEINRIAREYGLFVIEDAAQSFGAVYKGRKACSLAEIGCTSFFPAKPLGCYGDGGMIFTNSEELCNILKSIRMHGQGSDKYDNVRIGINGRLDTIQAAILLAKFEIFPDEIKKRQEVAQRYNGLFSDGFFLQESPSGCSSAWAQYSIRPKDHNISRNEYISRLKDNKVPNAIYYPKPLNLQYAFISSFNYYETKLLASEEISKNIFSIPMHPYLGYKSQSKIIEILNS